MRVYLVALVLAAGCDTLTGKDCTETVDQTIDVQSPAQPAMELKVDSCRVDVDACGALCIKVMADNNINPNSGGEVVPGTGGAPGFPTNTLPPIPYTKCAVTFEGATTHVEIGYVNYNGGPNCPQFAEGAGGGGL